MSEKKEILQRKILRVLFRSAEMTDENVRWRRYRFNADRLEHQLRILSDNSVPKDLVHQISDRLGLVVLRIDPLKLSIYGFEKSFDRQTIAEGMGAAGVQFFPTRQSASRSAFEAAREAVFFGAGDFDSQFFECPIAHLLAHLDKTANIPERGPILRDLREGFASNSTIFDILTEDRYFKANIHDQNALLEFQNFLRKDPLTPLFSSKCKDFFDRRATIGVRDSMRWMLGSRHPWFDWNHAQTLISSAFEKHGQTNFNTPQIVYYAYDPNIDEFEIEENQTRNQTVVKAFASQLENALSHEIPSLLPKLHDRLIRPSIVVDSTDKKDEPKEEKQESPKMDA